MYYFTLLTKMLHIILCDQSKLRQGLYGANLTGKKICRKSRINRDCTSSAILIWIPEYNKLFIYARICRSFFAINLLHSTWQSLPMKVLVVSSGIQIIHNLRTCNPFYIHQAYQGNIYPTMNYIYITFIYDYHGESKVFFSTRCKS